MFEMGIALKIFLVGVCAGMIGDRWMQTKKVRKAREEMKKKVRAYVRKQKEEFMRKEAP